MKKVKSSDKTQQTHHGALARMTSLKYHSKYISQHCESSSIVYDRSIVTCYLEAARVGGMGLGRGWFKCSSAGSRRLQIIACCTRPGCSALHTVEQCCTRPNCSVAGGFRVAELREYC